MKECKMRVNKKYEILKVLFKDFLTSYNSRNISKIVGISHAGAFKILKKLEEQGIVKPKRIGKAVVYSINFENPVACKEVELALVLESQNYKRWIEEFKKLFEGNRIIAMFGSAVKDYSKSGDIDILIVLENNKEIAKINEIVKEREKILPKKIHAIKMTHEDLLKNLMKKDKVMLDIVKNAVVLYGQSKYLEILKNVAAF